MSDKVKCLFVGGSRDGVVWEPPQGWPAWVEVLVPPEVPEVEVPPAGMVSKREVYRRVTVVLVAPDAVAEGRFYAEESLPLGEVLEWLLEGRGSEGWKMAGGGPF